MQCWLSVAGKGDHIRSRAVGAHLCQALLKPVEDISPGGETRMGYAVFIESALTIDAVERAYLAISRQ